MTATRMLRAATITAAVVLWGAAAALLWRTTVPARLKLPRLAVHQLFRAPALRQMRQHERFLDLDWLLGLVAQVVVVFLVARRTRRVGSRSLLAGAGLAALTLAAGWLAGLPFALAAHWWQRRAGLTRLGYAGWLLEPLPRLLGGLALGCALTVALMLVGRRLGRRAWAGVWLVLATAALAVAVVEPLLVTGLRPLRDPKLRAQVAALARVERVGGVSVLVEPASRRTTLANAEATGVGPTNRIVLWDTLLDGRFPRGEIRFVAAHELAHIARSHVWKGLAWFCLLALPGACLLVRLTDRRGGLGRPAAVPLAILVVFVLQIVTLPLVNAISRRYEAEADWIGLGATRDAASARGLFARFAVTSLEDPSPPGWVHLLLDDHPTPLQRIEQAEAWARTSRATRSRAGS